MQYLHRVKIENFRSIRSLELNCQDYPLTILVGNNDAGKSNILRALNLFFNGDTDLGKPLDFERDFSAYFKSGKGKHKRIRVTVDIHPPEENWFNKEGYLLRWTKTWKAGEACKDKKELVSKDGKSTKAIPRGTHLNPWLKQTHFRYIPAIKGPEYFSFLMESLNEVLNNLQENRFKKETEGFMQRLQEYTKDISADLEERLGVQHKILMPDDFFKPFFSSLTFGSERDGKRYPLSLRGDGLKVRHIPIILHFMATKQQEESNRVRSIWGFEEPENNLEMLHAFELAQDFLSYSKDVQVFLTTHSPAFYSLNKPGNSEVLTFYISKDEEGCTLKKWVAKKTTAESSEEEYGVNLDGEMGVLPYITNMVEEEVAQIKAKNEERDKQLAALKAQIRKAKPYLVYTEDGNTTLLERLLEHHGIPKEKVEFYHVSEARGKYSLDTAPVTAKAIMDHKKGIKRTLIHMDRDCGNQSLVREMKKRIKDLKIKDRVHFFVTKYYDLESYFLNEYHLNELYPELDNATCEKLINQATKDMEEESIKKFIEDAMSRRPCKGLEEVKQVEEKQRKHYLQNEQERRYGKGVLRRLQELVAEQLGRDTSDVDLTRPTRHIIIGELKKFGEI